MDDDEEEENIGDEGVEDDLMTALAVSCCWCSLPSYVLSSTL